MTTEGQPSQVRQRVDELVDAGSWPHPNDRACQDCGHVWFGGERAHHYDVDHLDHLADDPEDVHVVCVLCHNQRSFERGEDTSGAWRSDW